MYRFPPCADRRNDSAFPWYGVPISHATRGAATASLFDRCSLTVSICPSTPIEKSRHSAAPMTTSALLLSPRAAAPRGILIKGEWETLGGTVEQIFGSHLTSA